MQIHTNTQARHATFSNKLLLTVPEAARSLGLCRSFVYELVRAGELTSVKIGRARRVPFAALEAFITAKMASD
jgi:excisionase family DNA binding protein